MKLSGLFAIGDHFKRLSETDVSLETLGRIIDFAARIAAPLIAAMPSSAAAITRKGWAAYDDR